MDKKIQKYYEEWTNGEKWTDETDESTWIHSSVGGFVTYCLRRQLEELTQLKKGQI